MALVASDSTRLPALTTVGWSSRLASLEFAAGSVASPTCSLARAAVPALCVIIEAEIERFLGEIVGKLAEPLDFATDRECGVANLMADMLREHMEADVAIVTASVAFTGPLPAGPLRRETLWIVCSSSANPGVVTMTGAQLEAVVARGLDPNWLKTAHKLFAALREVSFTSAAPACTMGSCW